MVVYNDLEVSFERSHDFSTVGGNNSRKTRNGSRDGLFAQESKDTKLSKTSVVDLSDKSLLLLFRRSVLGETKGVVQVEGNVMLYCHQKKEGVELDTQLKRNVELIRRYTPARTGTSSKAGNFPGCPPLV